MADKSLISLDLLRSDMNSPLPHRLPPQRLGKCDIRLEGAKMSLEVQPGSTRYRLML
jgi:hypothetical protein